MKEVIRTGVFETNSSSVHSICISKNTVGDVSGKHIYFSLGEYGWENDVVSVPSYLYTAIALMEDREEKLETLKNILDKHNVTYDFEPIKVAARKYHDEYYEYVENAEIDHYVETISFVNAMLEDEDLLMRGLFDEESIVYTGNDNQDPDFERCCVAESSYYDEINGKWCYIPNPYHDEEKYDYFLKEN